MKKALIFVLIFVLILSTFSLFGESLEIKDNKPVKFFELYGFLSLNHRLSYNLTLNGNNPYLSTTALKDTVEKDGKIIGLDEKTRENTLSWATLQLHLGPVINIAETMEIHSQISLFANNNLGTNNVFPDTIQNGILRDSQQSISSAIAFEGLWGIVSTPIGELKFGRMPFNWGLGILYNDGNSVTDYSQGDYIDRIQLTVPLGNFKIIPAFDFASEGIMQKYHDYYIDASQKDDAWQLSARILSTEDDPILKQEKIERGNAVTEFGAMIIYSWKTDSISTFDTDKNTMSNTSDLIVDNSKNYSFRTQNAKIWKLDGWSEFNYKKLTIRGELAFISGTIGKTIKEDKSSEEVKTQMVGFALETQYKFVPNKIHLSLLAGFATPDDAKHVQSDAWQLPGNAINSKTGEIDNSVDNFRFNKNYNINSLIWNDILGKFTAGYYTSLKLDYFFSQKIKSSVGFTFSGAFKAENTIGWGGTTLAIEPFIGTEYKSKTGFLAGIKYQIAFPYDGLKKRDATTDEIIDASTVHMLHSYLGFVF